VGSIRQQSWPNRMKAAELFVARHFSGCEPHAEEAAALFLALEKMCASGLVALDPDAALRDVLPEQCPTKDSLEAVELELAFEAELGQNDRAKVALRRLADETILKALLGPAAGASSWDPATIWARSVRGVINERVRLRGELCSCGNVPSNNEIQLTRSARGKTERGPRS